MKTRNIKLFSALILTLGLASCEDTSINEIIVSAPHIESFSPTEGYAGCEVTVAGSSLNNVVSATIGGEEAEVVQRVSDKQIVIKVPSQAVTGEITLSNQTGTGKSQQTFTMTYPAPEPDATTLPENVEVASKMLIFGKKMSVVTKVMFAAEGYEAHEAEIQSQNDREIVIQVPYVEADDAFITFEYYNGSALTNTNARDMAIKVARYAPSVKEISAEEATIGDIITLTGDNLTKVDRVLVDGEACMITVQTSETLKFVVPELSSFVDGDNFSSLAIEYNDGKETQVLLEQFKVKVPAILFWEDRTVWAQGRDVEEFTSFFSPQTGIAYSNSLWREFDSISFKYQEGTCSAVQVPAVSEDEYNSVVPYFFFTGVSAGNLQLNSPAGSASMLKNIYMENNSANDYRVTGNNGNCYGTPVLAYLVLKDSEDSHAALIEKVKNGTLEVLDESNYPIDTEKKMCGDISISSVSNSVKESAFAPGVFTEGEEKNTDVDSYILVLYYNHNGLDSSNRSLNVRRIGVLHIKHIDFRLYNNTIAPSSSSVTFDMYWMKHDYSNQ